MNSLFSIFKKNKKEYPLLLVENIHLKFGRRKILTDVTFTVEQGTITVITGKSGSGKTTLLGIISGLLKPNKGRVFYKGKNILRWGDIRRSFFRNRKIGFVFQFFNLLGNYSALDNIILPTIFNPFARNTTRKARELLKYLNLTEIKRQKPTTLSGGERQRIAIARAIINDPDIILADEPTGNLDESSAYDIKDLFIKLRDESNKALIIVTHDARIVASADQHYHLEGSELTLVKPDLKKARAAKKTVKKTAKKTTKKSTKKTQKKSTKTAAKSSAKKTAKSKPPQKTQTKAETGPSQKEEANTGDRTE